MFNFTPLLGAQSPSPASQSLLEFEGGIKLLVDVGWDDDFDVAQLAELERSVALSSVYEHSLVPSPSKTSGLFLIRCRHVPTISLILLTHATRPHLAAYAHCCKHLPLFSQIPVYATTPVISLGRTLLQDLYASTPIAAAVIPLNALQELAEPVSPGAADRSKILYQPPTADEIASYFALINPLKYSQPHQPLPSPFSPPLNGLTITAYNAGHTLGGTIWHIQHGMESVVYAVDWNQMKENVFNGAAWLGTSGAGGAEVIEQLRKPTALVCSTKGCERPAPAGGRAKRDEALLDMAQSALAKGGTVLIPTDTSARVLELAYMFEHAWRRHAAGPADGPLASAKLYCASRTIGATMRYARSMMEWMDDSVIREFEAETSENAGRQQQRRTDHSQAAGNASQGQGPPAGPFEFRFLKLIERQSQMEKLLRNGSSQVIIASDASLDWGFSNAALAALADGQSNLVLLTDDCNLTTRLGPGRPQSLASVLWNLYREREDGVAVDKSPKGELLEQVYTGGRDLVLHDAVREDLEGRDALLYQQYLATQRQLRDTRGATGLENEQDVIDDVSSESSSSSEDSTGEQQGKSLNFASMQQHKLKTAGEKELQGVATLLSQPGCYDWDVRGKKGRDALFPVPSKRRKLDDYGELIRPEDYLKAEERDAVDGHDLRETGSGKDASLGQKRRWGDVQPINGELGNGIGGRGKRRRSNQGPQGTAGLVGINQMNQDGVASDSESEGETQQSLGPSRLIYNTRTVQANFRIAYVNCAGLHDQRSLSMLIPLIAPRKLILVGGSESETAWLANECRQKLQFKTNEDGNTTGNIFTPVAGETVTASMDTNAWTVKLSEDLVRRLHWQNVRGLGVVTLTGQLAAALPSEEQKPEPQKSKRLKLESGEADTPDAGQEGNVKADADLPPTLDLLPAHLAAATRSISQPVHVGDLRLADLRRILQSTGHSAEFRGEGTLLIDGLVAVRKSLGGQVEVEGVSFAVPDATRRSESAFQAVRQRIYEGLAVISGSA